MFSVALKSIAFAWQTNKRLLIILILLNIFQGSVIYLQFTSFSSIVDEIIKIKLDDFPKEITPADMLALEWMFDLSEITGEKKSVRKKLPVRR